MLKSFNEIEPNLIKRSFIYCGITDDPNGASKNDINPQIFNDSSIRQAVEKIFYREDDNTIINDGYKSLNIYNIIYTLDIFYYIKISFIFILNIEIFWKIFC